MNRAMFKPSTVLVVLCLVCASRPGGAGADDARPTEWTRPAPAVPQIPTAPARSKPMKVAPPAAAKANPYLSLRALSLAEGEGKVETAEGVVLLRPGDRLGRDLVASVDVGLLVLERPAAPGGAGGDARVVIRFDALGKASVRIYHAEDPTRAEPRPVQ